MRAVRRARSPAPPARSPGSSRPASSRARCARIAPRTTGRSRRPARRRPISSRLRLLQHACATPSTSSAIRIAGKVSCTSAIAHDQRRRSSLRRSPRQARADADRRAERDAAKADRQRDAQAVEDRRSRSRPWSSVPSRNRGSPPATKRGGLSELERKLAAGLNGSVGAIQGASSAASNQDQGDYDRRRPSIFDERKLATKIVVPEARR